MPRFYTASVTLISHAFKCDTGSCDDTAWNGMALAND